MRVGVQRGELWAVHGAVALFGVAGLLGKLIAAPPLVIVCVLASIAALVLGAWMAARARRLPVLAREQAGWLAITGAVLAVHWGAFFQAIHVSTVAVALLAFATFPVWVTLLEPGFGSGRLRGRDLGLACAVALGLALLVPTFDLRAQPTQGAAWGVLSGFTFAVLTLLNRRCVQQQSALLVAAGQNAVAAVILAPFVLLSPPALRAGDWLGLLGLGVFCTAGAHALFIRGLRTVRASVAGVIAALEPVYGILFALLVLGEVPTARTLAGGVIILAVAMWVSATATRTAGGARERP
jgi:drug/metabolite transporter (DMT)-like permease